MPKVFTPWSARKHRAKSQDTMFSMTSFGALSVLLGSQLSKIERALWTRQTRWQTSRRANPWHGARSLVWDVTVVSQLAASYVDRAATDAGTVADMRATRKTEKYSTLSSAYRFEPIAVENLGVFSSTTLQMRVASC